MSAFKATILPAVLAPYIISLANQNVPTPARVQDLAANCEDLQSSFSLPSHAY